MIEKLWPLLLTVCLCACADISFHERGERAASAPFFFLNRDRPNTGETYLADEDKVFRPMQDQNLAERSDAEQAAAGYAPEPVLPAGCSLADRFDRDGALAYNFNDGQSRLALHMDMGNVGLGGVEIDKVMIKFRYKFQQPSHRRRDACRYPSHFQGLIGSSYNELVQRKHNTVWDELRDKKSAYGIL